MYKNKTDKENHFDVIVIGGGASGMMASSVAASLGKKVFLLEKNKNLGEKLKITGGGRCNITNAEFNDRIFAKNYGSAEQFLYSALSQFSVKDTFEFFEKRGLPLVVQASKRAFPYTEKAIDVFKVLEKELKKYNVVVKTNSPVNRILKEKNKITGVQVGKNIYTANNFVLATGGVSHRETGSTGDGFVWLKDLGHKVKPPTPTIVPLSVKDAWIKSMPGISIPNMKITFYVAGVKKIVKKGKILFTHFGISGPLILNVAGEVADMLHDGEVSAKIDMFPDMNEKELENKIIKVFDENKNKMFKNILFDIVPAGTAPSILSLLTKVDGNTKVHSISREARKELVFTLKNLPVSITGLMGFDRAVVADGGVDLTEIDTRTMKSKIIENLFITGDLLHINRPSGGYSLQMCWTTGFVAGKNA